MSADTLVRELVEDSWNFLDESDFVDETQARPTDSAETDELSFRARWQVSDPVDEVLLVLNQTGREREARVITQFLGDKSDAELHRAALASMQEGLAEDWDSPEDAVYDEL